jgi:2-polyprenyl-6-methoxyphenol hydroxylase-like FAD-dependent oxidoreductase
MRSFTFKAFLPLLMSAASFATVSSLSRPTPRRVAVVGASLGGLAAAQALNQTGWTVHVYERASGSLHDKGGGLLDALSLRESFQSISTNTTDDAIDHAIALYSQAGVERAQALHNRSRQLSQQFVPAAGLSKIVSPSVALSASSNQ